MMTRKSQNFLALAAAILVVSLSAQSTALAGDVYDAVTDFSISSNPNGAWSYLYNNDSGPQLLTNSGTGIAGTQGVIYWSNGINIPNNVAVFQNTTSSTVTIENSIILPTNLLGMGPELGSDITRWTAPTEGTWSISGLFQGIDLNENSHGVEILENSSTVLASGSISSYGQQVTFDTNVTLAQGDTIDFVALGSSNYTYLSTGLAATIQLSSVPEPSTLVLACIASLGVAVAVRWKRRRASC